MSYNKAKFPGKPVKRLIHGGRTKEVQQISYLEKPIEEKGLSTEIADVEAEIIRRAKIFRDLFSSDSLGEDEKTGGRGFDEAVANRLKGKYEKIQAEVYSLQVKLQEFGVKPSLYRPDTPKSGLTESIKKPVVVSGFPSRGAPNVLPLAGKETVTRDLQRTITPKSSNPTVQPLRGSTSTTATFTTPLSPLPLRLVSTKAWNVNVPINTIPFVRRVEDIPTSSAYRSGKFVVEVESESESDDENIENVFPVVQLQNQTEAQGSNHSGKTLVRLNQCPVGLEDGPDTGFAVIIDKTYGMSPSAPLCYRCGSAGIGQLIFCSSCCEPYHPYCSGDEAILSAFIASSPHPLTTGELGRNITGAASQLIPVTTYQHFTNSTSKTGEISDANSILSPPATPNSSTTWDMDQDIDQAKVLDFKRLARTWVCESCYVCYICKSHHPNLASDCKNSTKEPTFLKCPFCPRVVHPGCCHIGRKGNSTSQKTRVCEQCYKCSSCGKRIERRGYRNDLDQLQPLCVACIRQKKKGSYCPICSACYDDDDFDTKMMQCAKCECWIHADCENLTSEQYQILSNLPESVEYICRDCENPQTVYWRKAILYQIEFDWKELVSIFQNLVSTSSRKLRVLQPNHGNTPLNPKKPLGIELATDSVSPPQAPSPSSKENTTIVRQLFPSKGASSVIIQNEKLKDQISKPLNCSTNSSKLNPVDKECFVLLQDCKKSVHLLLKDTQQSIPVPTNTIEPTVELEICRTPKKLVAQPLAVSGSPQKCVNTVIDSIISQINFPATSVRSIHDKVLNLIKILEEQSPGCHLKSHFKSAFAKAFPWFNPDAADSKPSSSEAIESLTLTTLQGLDAEDGFKLNEISNIELQGWNPFEEFKWDDGLHSDCRLCSFCQKTGDSPSEFCGRLLWAGLSEWVHVNCALWSSEVWEGEDGALKQVGVALTRSKGLECMICRGKGASVSCCVQSCPKSFHFPCALQSSCILLEDKGMFCPEHVNRSKGPRQLDMRVLRQVYIDTEWIRKKDKVVWSNDIAVYIGSLKIESLGHLAPLSVEKESEEVSSLIPLNYEASRIFWSFDSTCTSTFPKKLKYSVGTVVKKQEARRSKYCKPLRDINIRVDHTKPRQQIAEKLGQVKAFHDWVDRTPIYIDEYFKEWLYPCRLTFDEMSQSSGSDADTDGEDDEDVPGTKLCIEDDLFTSYVMEAESEDFNASFDDLFPAIDSEDCDDVNASTELEMEIGSDTDVSIADTEAETVISDCEDFLKEDDLEDIGHHPSEDESNNVDCLVNSDPDVEDCPSEVDSHSIADSQAETVSYELDFLDGLPESSDGHEFVIPQMDGGGDSDSETECDSSGDEEGSDTDSEDKNSSSSDESDRNEGSVSQRNTKLPRRFTGQQFPLKGSLKLERIDKNKKRNKLLEQKVKEGAKTVSHKKVSGNNQRGQQPKNSNKTTAGSQKPEKMDFKVHGGRSLRSRKKLQEAKLASQKKQEFKCSGCKKDYSSQASLKRHTQFCKQSIRKKGNKASQILTTAMAMAMPLPKAVPETPKKRGRKPKSSGPNPTVSTTTSGQHKLFSNSRSQPGPSSSSLRKPFNEECAATATKGVAECSATATFSRLRVDSEEDGITYEMIPALKEARFEEDGKVYCTRCKNTYRTSHSFKNHLGNCFYLSSDCEDDEELEDENQEQPQEEPCGRDGVRAGPSRKDPPVEFEESDTETTSDCSDSTVDEMPPTQPLVQNGLLAEMTQEEREFDLQNQTPPVAVECENTEGRNNLVYEATPTSCRMSVTTDANIVGAVFAEETFESHSQGEDSEHYGIPNVSEVQETNLDEEIKELAEVYQNGEAEPQPEANTSFVLNQENLKCEFTEASQLGLEPSDGPISGTFPEQIVNSDVQLQPFEPPVSDFRSDSSWNPETAIKIEPTGFSSSSVDNEPTELNTFVNTYQHQRPPHQEPIPTMPPLPLHNFHSVQGYQNVQTAPVIGGMPFQQHIPSSVFQYHQQQLQTMTFQDTATGQLVTIQVPVMSQQQQAIPTAPQELPTPVQQQQSFYNNIAQAQAPLPMPIPQQATEAQYEQYKQQIQAAVQLQRNTLLQQGQQPIYQNEQHQQAIFQQQITRTEPRVLSHQGGPSESQLYSQNTGQPLSEPPPMLMSLNPIAQHQHHGMVATPMVGPRRPYPHQASDGVATYMVVQQCNTSADSPVYTHHHAYNPTDPNTDENQERHLVPPQNSPILVSAPEHLHNVRPEQVSGGCSRQLVPHRIGNCTCADCVRLPNSFNTVLHTNPPFWTIQKPPLIPHVRKQKAGRVRARLASIVSERQGQGLQLFRSLTSPNATLPRLLPATAATTFTTTGSQNSTLFLGVTEGGTPNAPDIFKPPQPPVAKLVPTSAATTVTLDSLTAPIVSASMAPTLLKAPTPSPNIAVVRPMEHPLQKISDQIQQLGSTFTLPPSNTQIEVNLNLTPSTSEERLQSNACLRPGVAAHLQPITATIPSQLNRTIMEHTPIENPEQIQTPLDSSQPSNPGNEESSEIKKPVTPEAPINQGSSTAGKSIKILLQRPAGGDSYSINKISGSTATSNNPGVFKTLKIKGNIRTGDQAGTSTDMVVHPVVSTIPIPDPNADEESNRTIAEDDICDGSEGQTCLETSVVLPVPSSLDINEKGQQSKPPLRLTHRAVIVYEVKIDDKVQYKSCDVRAVWGYILERVQGTRRNHNLPPLAYPATNISLPENKREAAASFNKLGLTHRAVQFLLDQIPGVKNAAEEGHVFKFQEPSKTSIEDSPVVENPTGAARSEGFGGRKPFDMFGWLASKHRQPEVPAVSSRVSDIKGANLPMAMKYRNMIRLGTKHLNVFWSSIHGRGLFTTKDIESGDMIIEYAGEVIRPVVTDLREKYYESKGIGCYMFRIDDESVVDATLKGNAARFINHSCDPNCRSKTVDIKGKKHILIFALRRIIAGEELTYDYKFEIEDGVKLPCFCGTKKCGKFLN